MNGKRIGFRSLSLIFFLLLLGISAWWSFFTVRQVTAMKRDRLITEEGLPVAELATTELVLNTETDTAFPARGVSFLSLSFSVSNSGSEDCEAEVYVSTAGKLRDGCRYRLAPGETRYVRERFEIGTDRGTEEGNLRIVLHGCGMRMSDILIRPGCRISGPTGISYVLSSVLAALGTVCFLLAAFCIFASCKSKRETGKLPEFRKDLLMYGALFLLTAIGLLILYRRADLTRPLFFADYARDEMNVYYMIHMIAEGHMDLTDPFMGGIFGAEMFDHPSSDRFSFLIVRGLSLLTSDPYRIAYLFYFFCFFFNAGAACYACRRLKMQRLPSVFVAVLFAFSVFAQSRFEHMWLMPYGFLAVAVSLAAEMYSGYSGEYEDEKRKLIPYTLATGFLCAQTGAYYAFFACVLFAASAVFHLITRKGRIKQVILYFLPVCSCALGLGLNILPNLVYTLLNGNNPESEVGIRAAYGSEVYGLRLFRLFLPREDHRIPAFRFLTDYTTGIPAKARELFVNENTDASLGCIAVLGMIIAIAWAVRAKEGSREKLLSFLGIVTLFTAVSGGFGTLFSVAVSAQLRSFCRMSLILLFIGLVSFGIWAEKAIGEKKNVLQAGILLPVLILGVADQTTDYRPDTGDLSAYAEYHAFLDEVEEDLPEESCVFVLPYHRFPSDGSMNDLTASTETYGIRFSAAAIQGRAGDLFNRHMASLEGEELKECLKNAGYNAIYCDVGLADVMDGPEAASELAERLKTAFGSPNLLSSQGRYFFWRIE